MNTDFDAIVVGSGISGGWAAKELAEKGLKTLVLERGRPIEHGKDYLGEHMAPWEIPYGGLPLRDLYDEDYSIQQKCYAFGETTRQFWNNDRENPYVYDAEKPFAWIRANVVGGRSLMWARQCYRWSDLDFEANQKDGYGVDWPIRYDDIAPWYGYVERFVGISGEKLGLSHLPDGDFQPPMDLNVVERHVADKLQEALDRVMTIGRVAVLTEPKDGRAVCHYCGPCHRGCSVGAYFSSLSSTLPAAEATGNYTLQANAVVESLEYDAADGRVAGVRVVDAETKERTFYTAKLVFLCASAIGSTQILMNSKTDTHPTGFANASDSLGRYLMDHTYAVGARGIIPGFEKYTTYGNRPNGFYIPRFRNLSDDEDLPFLRGYGYQGSASRMNWRTLGNVSPGYGAEYKEAILRPGPWSISFSGFGECLPNADNRMLLDDNKIDRFGIPQVKFDFAFGPNEAAIRADILEQAKIMLRAAGAVEISEYDGNAPGGLAIHEMGTARMGRDPHTSVLNGFNQAHAANNLFVTDGACMTSSSCVNPSITYMALTARAVDYAVTQLRDGQI
ncbi:MAG: GMC family oxidoreductase [Gammaproteobacteria bacterium]|nr:GMC family oxidoreductase [Gammaproteobacteria bacterium]